VQALRVPLRSCGSVVRTLACTETENCAIDVAENCVSTGPERGQLAGSLRRCASRGSHSSTAVITGKQLSCDLLRVVMRHPVAAFWPHSRVNTGYAVAEEFEPLRVPQVRVSKRAVSCEITLM
jgi:hypothetical protein